MGLSSAEKEGCRRILIKLDSSDLLSLCETVLKNKTSIRVRAELIMTIIEESKSARELLNRKKVYRYVILEYLNNEKIFMYANSTKHDIIEKSLEHWRKPNIEVESHSLEQHTVSVDGLTQLTAQITKLSIHSSQKVGGQVDKAESLTTGDAQNDEAGMLPPKAGNKAASSARQTPRKSRNVPHPGDTISSMSTSTRQSSASGTKPKGKTAPQSTKGSLTLSVDIVSADNTDDVIQILVQKGSRTKKH